LIIAKENEYLKNCRVDAFDIYQDAIKQARTNLRLNGLEKQVNLRQGVLTDYPEKAYSIVIANLPPIAIAELWPQLIEKVADNGKLILSGILRHNFTGITQKLTSKGFKLIDNVLTDLWCLIVMEKDS
jgi:ribosomal protein L11 methyltransferase